MAEPSKASSNLHPDTVTKQAEEATARAEAGRKAYEEAIAAMPNARIAERVRAAHSRAHTGPELLEAMKADYDRLVAEEDAAKQA